ncbi:uncharacterized protein V6R79_004357 [Siganus canaliculatus]
MRFLASSECRNPHTNPSPRTSSPYWAFPGFSWVANKVSQQTGLHQVPGSDSVSGHCSGAVKDSVEKNQLEEEGAAQKSHRDVTLRGFRHQRGGHSDGRKFQHHRALNADLHGDSVNNIKITSITGHPRSSSATEKTLPQELFISQVPLRLQIKVSGQRGSLGISIAGGKGSLPYKNHDEGIFISRVNDGGASEKAGIHVGDRLLEVNGLDLQGATHQEAVSALRNAGSCIKLKVLRERLLPREVCDPEVSGDPRDVTGRQLCSQDGGGLRGKMAIAESSEDCLSNKIEAFVCNGNGISDLESGLNKTSSQLEAGFLMKKMKTDSSHNGKHTMAIPRIILTHPSTSDEDVELLTQSPSRQPLHEFDAPGRHVHSVCYDSAFYSP